MKTFSRFISMGILLVGLFLIQWGFAQGKMKPTDGSIMVMSKMPFAEALGKIKQAITEQDLMILDDIDGQAMMKMAGKEVPPLHQIIFFHPRFMKKVYEANPMAGIVVPLKFVVMEKNGKTIVRYFPPSSILKPYKGTETVAQELDNVVNKIVSSIK